MEIRKTSFIFVTGGVVSSLGKGIVASSLGVLLKSKGYTVALQKFDPYLNLDPGTMSPYQHGEVFVTDDGTETDLDLGHYERFIDQSLSKVNNVTSGMIYWEVLNKERNGDYLGNTVQIIPHITNAMKDKITTCLHDKHFDFVITEIGGTVGDIESLPFLEAIRQFQYKNKENTLHMHLTLVPYLPTSGEFKTKPTQHSVRDLRQIGIHPDIIVCRSHAVLSEDIKQKIALFCDVDVEAVVTSKDCESIYDVPLDLEKESLAKVVCEKLNIENKPNQLHEWEEFIEVLHRKDLEQVKIAIVGKYTSLSDSYLSVVEALKHAAVANLSKLHIEWIEAESLENGDIPVSLKSMDGIVIPGGFGDRGVEGKIVASKYARENNIPYLGLCLGMHVATIDFARHVVGLTDAHSKEFHEEAVHHVIDFLPDQTAVLKKGGTMRLGAYPCKIIPGTKLHDAYGESLIYERHRHRYEFNNTYKQQFEENGLVFSGLSEDESLVEVVELKDHPWFVACQYHPEFKSRPYKAHPLFKAFMAHAKVRAMQEKQQPV